MLVDCNDKSSSNRAITGQSMVAVIDPNGRLRLARWRLQSDGFHVYYIKDLTVVEPLLKKGDIKIIILSVDGEPDLELLASVRRFNPHINTVVVLGESANGLRKRLTSLGIKSILSRPINYPALSDVVKVQLTGYAKGPWQKKGISRLRRAVGVPLGILKICFGYGAVLDQIKTGIMVLGSQGEIQYVNRPLMSLLGLSEHEVLASSYKDIFSNLHHPEYGSVLKILDEAFFDQGVSRSGELIVKEISGSSPFEAETHPVFDHNGRFSGAFLIIHDTSNPKKMEQALVQSEKLAMMGQLAAGAAHEIRNPLTSVRGFIQLLKNELAGTPKMEYLNIIIKEIDRVNSIVNEFLKLAKPAPPNRKEYDLRSLFEDIQLLTESEAFLKQISFRGKFDDQLPLILVDEEQIKQVIINIVRNSFEAMQEGGVLSVQAYKVPDENMVCLELSDTGSGMDEKTLKNIFEPFFTTKENGTGLGLSVSSEIIKSHGGRMDIQSQVGRGTTVYLYFPC